MSLQLPPGRLYGETLKSRKIANFELSERCYSPHFKTPRHSHKQALFCFVIDGNYTETYGAKTRECRPSSLLFHPADELHAEHFHDSGGRSFIIELGSHWLKGVSDQLTIVNGSTDFSGGTLEVLARRVYRELFQMDEASAIVIEGLMLEMMGESARCLSAKMSSRPPRWLQSAKELIRERFSEHLTLTDVASAVGVHPVHLAQMFHRNYSCTVGEFLRKLRIEHACRELVASEAPIVEIALAAGFCDQSHFTRTFKRCTGLAPAQYRDKLRRRREPPMHAD
jgi:AraC family transcriptional regulator